MATVIEREVERPSRRVIVERESDSGAGWAVALIVLLAVLAVLAFAWVRYRAAPTPAGNTAPSINVSVPAAQTPATGGATGGATPGTGGPTTGP